MLATGSASDNGGRWGHFALAPMAMTRGPLAAWGTWRWQQLNPRTHAQIHSLAGHKHVCNQMTDMAFVISKRNVSRRNVSRRNLFKTHISRRLFMCTYFKTHGMFPSSIRFCLPRTNRAQASPSGTTKCRTGLVIRVEMCILKCVSTNIRNMS